MLACAADRLLAAPFSIVGSIGVVATAPNVAKLLDTQGVEVVQKTAGEYKRTINIFTPNTEEGLKKFEDELNIVHDAFIEHVTHYRPQLATAPVFTGETWLGANAQRLGLIDDLSTSDAYLRARQLEAEVLLVRPKPPSRPRGLAELLSRLEAGIAAAANAAVALAGAASPLGVWGHEGAMGAVGRDLVTGPGLAAAAITRAGAQAPRLAAEVTGGPLAGEASRQRN